MRLGPRGLALAATAALLMMTVACGRSEQPVPAATQSPTPTPAPTSFDVEATLKGSGEVMQGLGSFHFRLYHEKGSLRLLPGFLIDEVEGDVVNPDKLSVSFNGRYGTGLAIKASLIALGGDSYMTNPLTGRWESVAAKVSPLGFFNPGQGIGAMVLQLQNVRPLSDGLADEVVYRLGGDLPSDALSPLLGTTLEDTTVRVELTIDAKDLYLLRARFSGRVTPTDTDDMVRVITVSAFNEPVDIQAPL